MSVSRALSKKINKRHRKYLLAILLFVKMASEQSQNLKFSGAYSHKFVRIWLFCFCAERSNFLTLTCNALTTSIILNSLVFCFVIILKIKENFFGFLSGIFLLLRIFPRCFGFSSSNFLRYIFILLFFRPFNRLLLLT